jgi:arylsulfatase A-like enzyme
MDVHDPYLPPEPYRSRFSPTPGPGGIINWEFHVPDRLSPGELQSEVDAYDGAIAYADHQLGRLLAGLAARRPGRDLLVFLTSDHGEEFGEHGGFLHGAHLYRETIQVPLVLWQPGRVPAGRRVAQPVSNASIPATVLDLVNGNPERFPVPSLTALWRESPPAAWPMPVAELSQRTWAPARHPVHHGSLRSAVDQEWHYIESSAGSPELFHLLTDPKELNNRAAEDALTPVIARFRRGLPAWRHGAAFERLPPVLADLSPVAPAKAQSAQTPNGLQ